MVCLPYDLPASPYQPYLCITTLLVELYFEFVKMSGGGVYTNIMEALENAADPTSETLRVFDDAGKAHEWVEATTFNTHRSSCINHPGHSGVYQGNPVHPHANPAVDLGTFNVTTLSRQHLAGIGPNQGEATVGKEDMLFNTRVLSESQVRDRRHSCGFGQRRSKLALRTIIR
jgi:hypothetical protein